MLDDPGCFTYVMGAGRACGHNAEIRPLETKANRQVAGNHVDNIGGDEEWRDPFRTAVQDGVTPFFYA